MSQSNPALPAQSLPPQSLPPQSLPAQSLPAQSLIDQQRYPIGPLDAPQVQSQISHWRAKFQADGICILDGFVPPAVVSTMVREAESVASLGYHNRVTGNAYLRPLDLTLPETHPLRWTETTALSAVAGDQIPETHALKRLYRWPVLTDMIRQIVGLPQLYFYDCPLGCINLSVMSDQDYLRWHFDQSDFVVSIPLQEAEQGGQFEYVRNLRSENDECYDAVAEVLQGDRRRVRELSAAPGSLVLFQGKYTLHRVTPIVGNRPRLYALLGYAEQPGVGGSDYLRMIRYGRTR